MIETIKKIFGIGPKVNYQELIVQGAVIVDVRTKGEYQSGHVKGSINIPLDNLGNNLSKIKINKHEKTTTHIISGRCNRFCICAITGKYGASK
jgi:rhodanese-related sulfurtransferase